jgi:hypothetical protein
MAITFPSDTSSIITEIRDAIGRDITFMLREETACTASGCGLDPVTDTSINSFCTTCSGVGYVVTYSGWVENAHITWGSDQGLAWATGGQIFEGDCRIQVAYTQELVDDLDYLDYIIVDGKEMTMRKKIYRGVPELNRILMDLQER